ncbi:NADH:flavin oxidoreductase/NADH oxidase-like protein [Dendryphion nanum]|uniref:NADH:flavin oxidoreductase/NADH oxidase-like protein n=1 Tax=Dendryphion nanum TaxID=256645 RepID=A0A9P9IKN7_9PLEO|nr:NADH:flavin oxidoreductase/NADH oxidase-like protein [Dendryphion nanum]
MALKLASPLDLPSGVIMPNRIIKAAMSEELAGDNDSDPGEKYIAAYSAWADGGWGGLLTGNVDVSLIYRCSNATIAIKPSPSTTTLSAWTTWSHASQRSGTPTIVQLVHPGRQSPAKSGNRPFSSPAIAPSSIPINIGNGLLERAISKLVFGTPREMTLREIAEAVQLFANGAKAVYDAGFKGIEIHAAHGYLLSSFLSPKSNVRTDVYGGTAANRARIVVEVIRAVRRAVPELFCVGIKLNSADVAGAENLEESLEQVGLIVREQIDFLEISGGSYENLRMAEGDDPKAKRTVEREAFFLDYAQAVRERYPGVVLMVTGGFRSREGMEKALESGACDLVGVARPAAVWPHWPRDVLLNKKVLDDKARAVLSKVKPDWWLRWVPVKMIGIGADTMYYAKQISVMGAGKTPQPPLES